MGVTDFGRGNKAITYRALGVDMKIVFFRGLGTAVYFSGTSNHLLYMWYHALLPSLRFASYPRGGFGVGYRENIVVNKAEF